MTKLITFLSQIGKSLKKNSCWFRQSNKKNQDKFDRISHGIMLCRENSLRTRTMRAMQSKQTDTIVLAGGCFWGGMEELFRQETGVLDTECGYTGGENENPSYQNHPGHAEALRIVFDTTQTSLLKLLDFFSVCTIPPR